jgi:phytoene dehydrogenase-like protein
MKPNKKTRIGIIGAGAAGLTAAYYLKKQGYENITLLEKEGRIGGKCNSLTYHGKSFDLGANYITSSYKQVRKLAGEYGADMYTEGPLHAFDVTTGQLTSLLKAVTKTTSFFTLLWQSIRYTWKRWWLQNIFSAKHVGFKNISQHPEYTQPFKQWLQANGLQALEPVFSVPITLMGYGNLDEIPAAYALTYMRIGTFLNLMMAAINPNILGWPKRFVQGYERLFEKISWEFEVFTNVEVQSIHRKGQLQVEAIVHEQFLNKIVSTPKTFDFDHLIAATPYPLFVELLSDPTKEEKELAALVKVNPFVVTTYPVQKADKLFACTFSLPQPAIGEPNVVTRQFAGNDLVSFYTRYNAEQPIPKAQILENNKRFAEKMSLSPLPANYYTYSDWAYFPHVDAAAMQAGFYDRIEALQGHQHIYYTGGLFAFELVEAIACYSQALIKKHF